VRLTEGLGLSTDETPLKPTSYWRLSSRVEEHLLSNRQETAWLRVVFWLILGISASYVILFLRREDLTEDVVWILHLKGYVLILLMHAALLFTYRRSNDHLHIGPGLKKLKTKIPNESAVPVRITILQHKAITGVDEGYLWIEDGTIFYKGIQTAFRLNWEDIPPMGLWSRKDRPNLAANRMPTILPIPFENRDLKVKYEILDSHEDFGTRKRAATFYNSLVTWLRERPNSSLESLLPPTEIHPGFKMEGRAMFEPVYATGIMAALDLILILSMNFGVSFRGSAAGFAVLATLILATVFILSVRLFLHCLNSCRVRMKYQNSLLGL